MTFEKVRREVSFEILIPPWLARSAKKTTKKGAASGGEGGGVSGRREEGVVVEGGVECVWVEGGVECVCVWVVWCGAEGGGEESETSRVCLADAASQTECRLKSEFLLL